MYRDDVGKLRNWVQEMSKEPGMMVWLEIRDSKKDKPNENYARELMELFSLGIGNYTEKDIREAARAFSGWEIEGEEVKFNAAQHDNGSKDVLGQSGNWAAGDIVR